MKQSTCSSKSGMRIRGKNSKQKILCTMCLQPIFGAHINEKQRGIMHPKCSKLKWEPSL